MQALRKSQGREFEPRIGLPDFFVTFRSESSLFVLWFLKFILPVELLRFLLACLEEIISTRKATE